MLSRLSSFAVNAAKSSSVRNVHRAVVPSPLSSAIVSVRRSYTTLSAEEIHKQLLSKKTAAVKAHSAEPVEVDVAVQSVSNEQDKAAFKTLTGLPEKQHNRKVIIHQPARTAMQQGVAKHQKWRMEWVRDADYGKRWADPLMGWTASSDPLNTTYLYFDSLENAVKYAERLGYTYTVEVAAEDNDIPEKAYSDKFTYVKPEESEQW